MIPFCQLDAETVQLSGYGVNHCFSICHHILTSSLTEEPPTPTGDFGLFPPQVRML